jgi:hypothetical protein
MIVIPCFAVTYFYLKIFIKTAQVKKRAKSHDYFKQKKLNNSFKISKGLFASFFLCVASVLPYGLVIILDYEDTFPRSIHLYVMLFARINSVLNPILYATTNALFRDGFKNFFYLIFNKKKYHYSLPKRGLEFKKQLIIRKEIFVPKTLIK